MFINTFCVISRNKIGCYVLKTFFLLLFSRLSNPSFLVLRFFSDVVNPGLFLYLSADKTLSKMIWKQNKGFSRLSSSR